MALLEGYGPRLTACEQSIDNQKAALARETRERRKLAGEVRRLRLYFSMLVTVICLQSALSLYDKLTEKPATIRLQDGRVGGP